MVVVVVVVVAAAAAAVAVVVVVIHADFAFVVLLFFETGLFSLHKEKQV